MIWWRPADKCRSLYQPWALGLDPSFETRGLASSLIRKYFGVFALSYECDNDRDSLRW